MGKRVAQSYASGAGWLFAADMEQILPANVRDSKDVTGLHNIRYLVVERKQNLGRTENSATVSFQRDTQRDCELDRSAGTDGDARFHFSRRDVRGFVCGE